MDEILDSTDLPAQLTLKTVGVETILQKLMVMMMLGEGEVVILEMKEMVALEETEALAMEGEVVTEMIESIGTIEVDMGEEVLGMTEGAIVTREATIEMTDEVSGTTGEALETIEQALEMTEEAIGVIEGVLEMTEEAFEPVEEASGMRGRDLGMTEGMVMERRGPEIILDLLNILQVSCSAQSYFTFAFSKFKFCALSQSVKILKLKRHWQQLTCEIPV